MHALIVFANQPWNAAHQRPPHLFMGLARHFRILFVEEPQSIQGGRPSLETFQVQPGVTVIVPRTKSPAPGCHDPFSTLEPLLRSYLAEQGVAEFTAWLCAPEAFPSVARLKPRAVVFDDSQEPHWSDRAPIQGNRWETSPLQCADLVIARGPQHVEALRAVHDNVVCLPGAVDASHFSPVAAAARPHAVALAAHLHRGIGYPRLGFHGAIDERVDLELLAAVADTDPRWQVVLAGPLVDSDAAELTRRPNIHWIGQEDHAVLPQVLAQWDVCLLPYACSDAARLDYPSQALECMAFGRPVVSTALPDIVARHAGTVRVATGVQEFVGLCRDSLAERFDARARRMTAMASSVRKASWDAAVSAVLDHLDSLTSRQPLPKASKESPFADNVGASRMRADRSDATV